MNNGLLASRIESISGEGDAARVCAPQVGDILVGKQVGEHVMIYQVSSLPDKHGYVFVLFGLLRPECIREDHTPVQIGVLLKKEGHPAEGRLNVNAHNIRGWDERLNRAHRLTTRYLTNR